MAFRYVAPVAIVLALVFGVMVAQDRRARLAAAASSSSPLPEGRGGGGEGAPAA